MTGIVCRRSSSKVDVFDCEHQVLVKNCTIKGKKLSHIEKNNQIVVGDRVELTESAQISHRYARKNSFMRWLPHIGKPQVHCANIDAIASIISFDDQLCDMTFVTRCIVVGEYMQIPVFVVCNKADLCSKADLELLASNIQSIEILRNEYYPYDDEDDAASDQVQRLYTFFTLLEERLGAQFDRLPPRLRYFCLLAALGYPVCLCSLWDQYMSKELEGLFRDQTIAIFGPSGVGKSTLLNAVVPGARAKTREDRAFDGRHTTSTATLYRADSYNLIDTPGMEHVHLYAFPLEAIIHGFREFVALSTGCKFRTCSHLAEPGCKVREFAQDNVYFQFRYRIYKNLIEEWRRSEQSTAWYEKRKMDTGL